MPGSPPFNQLGWDAWWKTVGKQNTSDPTKAILWSIQGAGQVYRSLNCGQNWLLVPDIGDPPNSWGDAPAPVLADVDFVQRVDNIHVNGQHILIGEWQNGGGDWRGGLCKTEDDGITWEWTALYPLSIGPDGLAYPVSVYAYGGVGVNNPSYILGPPDGNYVELVEGSYIVVGYGAQFTNPYLPGNPLGNLKFRAEKTGTQATECRITPYQDPLGDAASTHWYIPITDPLNEVYERERFYEDYGFTTDKLWIRHWGFADGSGFLDYVGLQPDWFTTADIRPIWADLDSQTGTYLYLTVWANGRLELWKLQTADLSAAPVITNLGDCAIGDLFTSLVSYVHTPTFDSDLVFCFGRMDAPAGLGAGIQHCIRSLDGGATWASVESGWGVDIASSFRVEGTGVPRQFYAVRSGAGVPAFYTGSESLVYASDLDFDAGVGVSVDAMTVNTQTGQVAVGANAPSAGGQMILRAGPPYASWDDITGSFLGSNVRSLAFV